MVTEVVCLKCMEVTRAKAEALGRSLPVPLGDQIIHDCNFHKLTGPNADEWRNLGSHDQPVVSPSQPALKPA